MNRTVTAACLAFAAAAFAQSPSTESMDPPSTQRAPKSPQETPEAATPTDVTKLGSAARKPTDEKESKREIEAFYKAEVTDFDAKLARIDFPVLMITDDAAGTTQAKAYTKEQFASMMRPHFDSMKDAKRTHKPTITVLSDSLASVIDEYTITHNGKTAKGKCSDLLVKVDGKWRIKSMTEAGWGDMHEPKPGA